MNRNNWNKKVAWYSDFRSINDVDLVNSAWLILTSLFFLFCSNPFKISFVRLHFAFLWQKSQYYLSWFSCIFGLAKKKKDLTLHILKMTNFSFKISEQKNFFLKCYPEFLDFRLITNPVAISALAFEMSVLGLYSALFSSDITYSCCFCPQCCNGEHL